MALYSTAQVVVVILAPSLVFIIVVFLFYWLWFQCVYHGQTYIVQPPVQPVQPATDNGLWHVGRVVKHPGGEHVVALGNSLTVVKLSETLVDHPV